MDFSKCELPLHPELERRVAFAESAYDTIAKEAWVRVVFHDPTLSPVAVVGSDVDSAVTRLRAILSTYITLPNLTDRLRNNYDASGSQPRRFVKPPHIVIRNGSAPIAHQHPLVK